MIASHESVPVPVALSPGGTPGPQAGLDEVMTAVPGCTARKEAPVTPMASVNSPLAWGTRTAGLAWTGAHLRAAVPLRNTTTFVPRVTQNDLPLSAAVTASRPPWVTGPQAAAPLPG